MGQSVTASSNTPEIFWDIVDKVDNIQDTIKEKFGIEKEPLKKALNQFNELSSEDLKKLAKAWGGGGSTGHPAAMCDAVKNGFEDANTALKQRWEGEAYSAYRDAAEKLRSIFRVEDGIGDPAKKIGNSLNELADGIDTSWGDIVNRILALSGLIFSLVGLGLAIPSFGASLIVAAIGAILSIISAVKTFIDEIVPKALKQIDTLKSIREASKNLPIDSSDEKKEFPMPKTEDWKRQNKDPVG